MSCRLMQTQLERVTSVRRTERRGSQRIAEDVAIRSMPEGILETLVRRATVASFALLWMKTIVRASPSRLSAFLAAYTTTKWSVREQTHALPTHFVREKKEKKGKAREWKKMKTFHRSLYFLLFIHGWSYDYTESVFGREISRPYTNDRTWSS